MRRGRREKIENNSGRYLFYLAIGVLIIMIITFIVTFIIYKNKINKNNFSELTTEKIAELVPNETNSVLEQASVDIGKTIEEAVKEIEEKSNKEELKHEDEVEAEELDVNVNEVIEETNAKTDEVTVEEKVKDPEFSMPVDGEILRNFAKDMLIYSDTLQEWVVHLGIDIKAARTTVVKASEEGIVESIKNDPRYGLTIVIEHTNGYKTVYSNLLTTEFVSEGDKVEKGQSIGTVGNSASFEIVDEPHLHFEILKDNVQVDPNAYLK